MPRPRLFAQRGGTCLLEKRLPQTFARGGRDVKEIGESWRDRVLRRREAGFAPGGDVEEAAGRVTARPAEQLGARRKAWTHPLIRHGYVRGSEETVLTPGPCCPVTAGGPLERQQRGETPCRKRFPRSTPTRPSTGRSIETSFTISPDAATAMRSGKCIRSPAKVAARVATAAKTWRESRCSYRPQPPD